MKTTIKACIVTIALLAGINMNAQISPLKFGIKAGANLSNLGGDIDDTSSKAGFNAGITIDLSLPATSLYISTGLEFTTKGAKFDMNDELSGVDVTFKDCKINASYLQVPIHLGYKVKIAPLTSINFHAGPYFAYGIGGKVKLGDDMKVSYNGTTQTVNIKEFIKEYESQTGDEIDIETENDTFSDDGFKRFDFGIGIGAGVEISKIGIGIGYDFGLSNVSQDSDFKVRNRNGYVSVGLKF